jgi:chromosome partitioning protein
MKKPIIICVSSNKGGIGKTTTTKNLAQSLVNENQIVAVVDMDDQNNLTDSCKDLESFDLLVTDKSLEQLKTLHNQKYDYILIDNPPDLGEEAIHSYLVSDYILIPTTLTNNAIKGMQKSVEIIQQLKEHNPKLKLLGVLVTFFDRRKRESDEMLANLRASLGKILFNTVIRVSSSIEKSDNENILVQEYEKGWYRDKKSTIDYSNLAKEIILLTQKK